MTKDGIYSIVYGDGWLQVELPERTRVLKPPEPLPPLQDPARALREALQAPIDHEPLCKLVGPNAQVTIAFDDPVMPIAPMEPQDFREMAIGVLFEELEAAGVPRSRTRLVCANALHRKWTARELTTILGPKLPYVLSPGHLFCHDAEDAEATIHLGETERGFEVEVNRVVVDSDLLIYLSLPVTPFNGGWKSIVVGLGTWRSIRQHHRPFPFASGKSTMDHRNSSFQKLLNEMGRVVERALAAKGRKIFQIECVLNNAEPGQPIGIFAGSVDGAHAEALKLMERQQVLPVRGQSDVLIYGVPNREHYSKLSLMNPIHVRNWGLSYSFGRFRNRPLVRQGGILILVNPCLRQFHPIHQPSYIELFEKVLPSLQDPVEIWDTYAEDYARRPEYVHRYRYAYAYHGAHPLILYGQGLYAMRHLGAVFIAGARDPEVAIRLGFEPFPTVQAAIREAEARLGQGCSITYAPRPPEYLCEVT